MPILPDNSPLSAGFDDDDLVPTKPEPKVEAPPTQAQEPEPTPPADSEDVHPPVVPQRRITQREDATKKSSNIPPKLVEDVQENPELLRPVARSMAAVNLHNLFQRIQHPATPNKDRIEFQQILNKMAGLSEKEGGPAGGPGFSITINIPQTSAAPAKVIESTAVHLDEPEADV